MQNRSSDTKLARRWFWNFFLHIFFKYWKLFEVTIHSEDSERTVSYYIFFIRLPLDARILYLLVKSAFFWTRNLNRYLVFYKKSQTNLFRFTVWLVKKQNCIVTSKNSGKLSLMKCKIRKNRKKRINNSQFTQQCQPYIWNSFFQVTSNCIKKIKIKFFF